MKILPIKTVAIGLVIGLSCEAFSMESAAVKRPKIADSQDDQAEVVQQKFITLMSTDGKSFTIARELVAFSPSLLYNLSLIRKLDNPCLTMTCDGKTLEQVIDVLKLLAKIPAEELAGLKEYPLARESIHQGTNALLNALLSLDIPIVVKLVSKDEKSFYLPFQVACRSETLKNVLIDTGNAQAIPMRSIGNETLDLMAKLLYKVDELIRGSAQDDYIPRAFQPCAHMLLNKFAREQQEVVIEQKTLTPCLPPLALAQELKSFLNLSVALELLKAADYLDSYYILNAVTAFTADQIPQNLQEVALKVLSDGGDAEAHQKLRVHGCETLMDTPRRLRPYIIKHITHRKNGITKEYSIADLIKEVGQPELETLKFEDGEISQCFDLRTKKLTSLFGLKLLRQGPQAECLLLSGNCFCDLSLDKDLEVRPFDTYANLRRLYLSNNQLKAFPVGLFSGLTSLSALSLYNNQLRALPEGLFSGLTSLSELYLVSNQLRALPERLFTGLTSLSVLRLSNNQLSALPVGLFTGLTSLSRLELSNNQLSALPEGLFLGLHSLSELFLDSNQLSALQVGLFSGLNSLLQLFLDSNKLRALPVGLFSGLNSLLLLSFSRNQLSALPEGLFAGLHSLSELYLDHNQLSVETKSSLQKVCEDVHF